LSTRRSALWLFAVLSAIYLADGSFVAANGQKPNAWLSVAILEHGALTFSSDEEPFMYTASGREKYYLVPSALPGRSVGTFGLGSGLVALPAMFVARLAFGELGARPAVVWLVARAVAALCTAASAALVFAAAVAFVSRGRALALALAYALGGCAWSIASQALYQHGPNMLFLALGAFALARPGRRYAAVSGAAFAAASWCRPTSAVAVVVVGLWLLIRRRESFVAFVGGALVPLVLLALYQWRYLGAPWSTGQTTRAASIALQKTGSADPWQTPLLTGAAGLLASPSRGLLVFSPLFALAAPGTVIALREARFAWLRPLALTAAILTLLACKWFDWWGGWTYGYRPLVDATPLYALLMLPMVDVVWARRSRLAVATALLLWSTAAQALGAFTYDTDGWNVRDGHDIDDRRWRSRLWSVRDSAIVYYATHAAASRAARLAADADFVAHLEH
jgi:hypothetical protein